LGVAGAFIYLWSRRGVFRKDAGGACAVRQAKGTREETERELLQKQRGETERKVKMEEDQLSQLIGAYRSKLEKLSESSREEVLELFKEEVRREHTEELKKYRKELFERDKRELAEEAQRILVDVIQRLKGKVPATSIY